MDEYLQINSIQHYTYCKRRWALINLEQKWKDNADTILGQFLHKNADDPFFEEKRKDKLIIRSLPVSSRKLRLNGICDVIEFNKSEKGVRIFNYPGLWIPYVVEYKKGKLKEADFDIYQLVAEVLCVEEMFNIKINKSAVYYKSSNKRKVITINEDIRNEVTNAIFEMHELLNKQITPKAEIKKNCKRCSLIQECMPRLTNRKKSVVNYINSHVKGVDQ